MAIEYQLGRIAWSFRCIIDKTPEIAKALIPAGKIAEMLVAKSKIEGNAFEERRGGSQSVRIRPESFVGEIEFKDVCFSYPKDPRKKVFGYLLQLDLVHQNY